MGKCFNNIGGYFSGMSSVNINGRSISFDGDDIYIDGVLYVPAGKKNVSQRKSMTPGKIVSHDFKIKSNFNSISTKGFIDVIIRQSSDPEEWGVSGRLPENYKDKFDVFVEDETLTVSPVSCFLVGNFPSGCYIEVVTGKINQIQSGGSGNVTVKGNIDTFGDEFYLYNSGSGDFHCGDIIASNDGVSLSFAGSGNGTFGDIEALILNIRISGSADISIGKTNAKGVGLSISGSGDVSLSGECKTLDMNIAGSGDIDASGLKAESGKASIVGSGDIRCDVRHLSERIRGSGDIHNLSSDW